jgi:hypothetical protein
MCRFGPNCGEKMNYPRSSVYAASAPPPRQLNRNKEIFWEQISASAVYVISGGRLR